MTSNEITFLAGLAMFLTGAIGLALPNRPNNKKGWTVTREIQRARQQKQRRRRLRHQVYRLQGRLGRIHRD